MVVKGGGGISISADDTRSPRSITLYTYVSVIGITKPIIAISLFLKQIIAAMNRGDTVAVYSDVKGLCRRGMTTRFEGERLFLGNGRAMMSRHDIMVATSSPRFVDGLIYKKERDIALVFKA